MAPFEWAKNFNYKTYEKNIINEDIIPDNLFAKIQQVISSYCGANYTIVKSSYNSGHSRDCNDTGGTSNCSCDISGTYCQPANCSSDREQCSQNTKWPCYCNNCDRTYDGNPGEKNAEKNKED